LETLMKKERSPSCSIVGETLYLGHGNLGSDLKKTDMQRGDDRARV
jgi:hypothetical protein